jgi:hypothetical protein
MKFSLLPIQAKTRPIDKFWFEPKNLRQGRTPSFAISCFTEFDISGKLRGLLYVCKRTSCCDKGHNHHIAKAGNSHEGRQNPLRLGAPIRYGSECQEEKFQGDVFFSIDLGDFRHNDHLDFVSDWQFAFGKWGYN